MPGGKDAQDVAVLGMRERAYLVADELFEPGQVRVAGWGARRRRPAARAESAATRSLGAGPGRRARAQAGRLPDGGVWNPVLAGWTYAGDLLVWGALAASFPVAILTRSPGCELGASLAPGRPPGRGRAQAGLCRGPGPPRHLGGRMEKVRASYNVGV